MPRPTCSLRRGRSNERGRCGRHSCRTVLAITNLVGAIGLEPTTPTMSRWCSNQLSYAPAVRAANDSCATRGLQVRTGPNMPARIGNSGRIGMVGDSICRRGAAKATAEGALANLRSQIRLKLEHNILPSSDRREFGKESRIPGRIPLSFASPGTVSGRTPTAAITQRPRERPDRAAACGESHPEYAPPPRTPDFEHDCTCHAPIA